MDIIKLIVAFGLGAAAGAIGSKLYFESKAEDRADEEISEVKRYYLEKTLNEKREAEVKTEPTPEKEEEKPTKKPKKKAKEKTNYNNVIKDYKGEDRAMTEHPEEDMPTEPYEITESEFSNEKFDYDKISLTIYDEDEALVDESEELIEADDTIGSDLFDKFLADDMDIMYVRNNAINTDYEVKLVYGSYHDSMGIE